jgi:transporter family-2 protein
MIGIFISLISGALMSIQGVFNTEVTKSSSTWASASWVQFSALVTCLAIWALKDRSSLTRVFQVSPKYMLLGGVLGAFITFTVIRSMSSLGPAKSVMLIVISQLLVAYFIELLGIFGVEKAAFQWRKAIGMVIAIVGVILFKWE